MSVPFLELSRICREQGFPLVESQLDQFSELSKALLSANETKNFTRVPEESWEVRHYAESCLIAGLIPKGARVLDIGSGPGFPALPLAIVRPDLEVIALDSNAKMLNFLEVFKLSNVHALLGRVEDLGLEEQFDFVTGRAVAPLTVQMEVSVRPCKVHGLIVPFRTQNDVLTGYWHKTLGIKLEQTIQSKLSDGVIRVFPVYEKIARTAKDVPRIWAKIKAKPL